MEFNSYCLLSDKNLEITSYVKNLANKIKKGRIIRLSPEGEIIISGLAFSCWQKLSYHLTRRSYSPSLEILEKLRFILLNVHDACIVNCFASEIKIIRDLCNRIIASHPIVDDTASSLPKDIIQCILARTQPLEAQRLRRVCKKWHAAIPCLKKANEIIDWFISSPLNSSLEIADFTGIKGFNNYCLDKLTLHYPNLKSLIIPKSKLSDDALFLLHRIPHLRELDITQTYVLNSDSLKYLSYTPDLIYLKVAEWQRLKIDSLNNLRFTPHLKYLDLFYCWTFEGDTLKYLIYTPELEYLNVAGCLQLNGDSLKHLIHTPKLKYLIIGKNDHLDFNQIPANLSSIEIYCQTLRPIKH